MTAARRLRFLALSGSLRAASINTALLEAAQRLAPPDLEVVLYRGLGALPLFNPDLDDGERPLPAPVTALRQHVEASDALVIACPEYAHGIPGAFKNALDWLVGGPEFPGKPIALFHATARGTAGPASLREVLTTMSGLLLPDASLTLPLIGQNATTATLLADHAQTEVIRRALSVLASALRDTAAGTADHGEAARAVAAIVPR